MAVLDDSGAALADGPAGPQASLARLALLLRLADDDWLIVSVKHRKDVYNRLSYGVDQVTGGIEYVDLEVVEDSVLGRLPGATVRTPDAPGPLPPTAPGPLPVAPRPEPLFAAWSDRQSSDLGVTEPLLPVIRTLATEDQLLGLVEYAPQLTGEVLIALFDGASYDEVLDRVTRPVAADEPVDPDDFAAAVRRPATVVTTTDEDLRGALESGDFGRWKSFLHPTQATLVERRYSGPVRVGGGPGTGKTVVALHRVRHLVRQLPPGHDKPVLLTTYNKNLAADLRSRLLELGGEELLGRVDVSHVDQPALRVVREAEPGDGKQTIDDGQAVREWRALLDELGEDAWDPEFLHEEWTQVILGQAVGNRTDYFRARRAGRGKSIGRGERAEIWQLAERFAQRLDRLGRQTWDQVAERAARLEMGREQRVLNIARQQGGVVTSTTSTCVTPAAADRATAITTSWWTRPRTCAPRTGRCCAPRPLARRVGSWAGAERRDG